MIQNLLNTTKNLEINHIHNGNCEQVLKLIPNETVDCIITDPPYGYSFMGKDWDKAVPAVEVWKECFRVLKSGSFMFVMSSPRQDVLSQMIVRIGEAGFRTDFTSIYWAYATGFPKAMNVSKMVDKRLGGKGVITNPKTYPDIRSNNYSNSQGKTRLCGGDYEPEKAEAKLLDGSFGGFQPKPAVEIVIVAMKPLSEKTYVDQALTNGKGVTWLNDCRIPYESEVDKATARPGGKITTALGSFVCRAEGNVVERANETFNPTGRFPANLLASDNILDDGKTTKSPSNYVNRKPRNGSVFTLNSCGFDATQNHTSGYGDVGSFNRYFDLDAWFTETVKKLPKEVQKTFPFLIVPKASKSERNKGCENLPEKQNIGGGGTYNVECANKFGSVDSPQRNFHPTVKPLKLMSYLITLGSRPNDLVLDPFSGSGTTALAAQMLQRNWLNIELSSEYCQIQSARLKADIIKHEIVTFNKTEESTFKQEIKSSVSKTKDVSKTKRGTCLYKGNCSYRNEFGLCTFTKQCSDRSK